MNRFDAIRFLVQHLGSDAVVANLGTNDCDLNAAGDRPENFYMWGGMGLTASVGLGIALAQPSRRVVVLDGDGSLLMNMGVLATLADQAPRNLLYVVFDNELWAETGRQPTHTARVTDLAEVARGAGLRQVALVRELEEFQRVVRRALAEEGPWCIVAKVEETGKAGPLPSLTPDGNVLRFVEAMRS